MAAVTDSFRTEQEAFWAGEFGDAYIDRNQAHDWVARNAALFARVLARTSGISSVLELGANIGLNLQALRTLLPAATLTGVEINARAAERLAKVDGVEAVHSSIYEYRPNKRFDLVFTKTVLIHVEPSMLPSVYETMHALAAKYVVVVEYYNPAPVEVSYRGHSRRLFKRDFAGELLDRFPDLRLADYGFWYRRDRWFQDDVTWFLLEKTT